MTRRWRTYSPGDVTASFLASSRASLKAEMFAEGVSVFTDRSLLFSTCFSRVVPWFQE